MSDTHPDDPPDVYENPHGAAYWSAYRSVSDMVATLDPELAERVLAGMKEAAQQRTKVAAHNLAYHQGWWAGLQTVVAERAARELHT